MKQIQMIALLLLSQINYALEIHQVRISEISPTVINVSLDTEAEELYYFHSWRSQISGNNITIEAFYIEGFGSTIAYLNNNFEILINSKRRSIYHLNIKIYYTNSRGNHFSDRLQNQWSGLFSTPLSTPIFLTNSTENDPLEISYYNPNNGVLNIGSQELRLEIFDKTGKIIESKRVRDTIDFSYLPDGLYYFRFIHEKTIKTIPIILQKK